MLDEPTYVRGYERVKSLKNGRYYWGGRLYEVLWSANVRRDQRLSIEPQCGAIVSR
jgi:hypothetical protein